MRDKGVGTRRWGQGGEDKEVRDKEMRTRR